MAERFQDRTEAGSVLAAELSAYAGRPDVIVLGLPRGGIPVAYEVAEALGAPLDVFMVRKLGVPGHEELAMGAIATGGVRVLHREVVDELGISSSMLDEVARREMQVLERREHVYRNGQPPPDLQGRTVILVDDGLATGSTVRAAIAALRQLGTDRIVVAVPVGPTETCAELRSEADELICVRTPEPFYAVGLWYVDFSQTTDDEVRNLLDAARRRHEAGVVAAAANAGGSPLVHEVRRAALPLHGASTDYDRLLEMIGDARVVLIGEATHGTHEFYRERAEITKRLIEERGFAAVGIEGDWPDAYRVNRYVRGEGEDANAEEALGGFRRFPTWMWRNTVVLEFVEWLRAYNDRLPASSAQAGFYGLDLYSLYGSIDAVIAYLDGVDPEAARRARDRYACFEQFGEDSEAYGWATSFDARESCEEQVVAQLVELQRESAQYLRRDGAIAEAELFSAEQNARLAKNAEQYYRSMFRGRASSWNLRDRHMAETLDALIGYLDRPGLPGKVVVWEHNSHIGDARATELSRGGELNVGQLVRERYGREAVLIGQTTYTGTVTAALNWHSPAQRRQVRPALEKSYEQLFHEVGVERFLLDLRGEGPLSEGLREPHLERAIGVVYRPDTERVSHYFYARLPEQFDIVLHFDTTRAVEPLERFAEWEAEEVPEAYPTGL